MKKNGWLLPIVFLLGYLTAWGMILIDRQMVMGEQEALRQDLRETKAEMKLRDLIDDFGTDWQEMVIWNEKAIEPTKEAPSGQVDK